MPIFAARCPEALSAPNFTRFEHVPDYLHQSPAFPHYNVLSRLDDSSANRIFPLPTIGFYGDLGFRGPTSIRKQALSLFRDLCYILGITLQLPKRDVGHSAVFLGFRRASPAPPNQMSLNISLPPTKSSRWPRIIDRVIPHQSILHACMGRIIWDLGPPPLDAFSRFARFLTPLIVNYISLHTSTAFPVVSLAIFVGGLRFFGECRRASLLPMQFATITFAYTASSFEHGRVGVSAVLVDSEMGPPDAARAQYVLRDIPLRRSSPKWRILYRFDGCG